MILHSGEGSDRFVLVPFSGASHEEIILSGSLQTYSNDKLPNLSAFPGQLQAPVISSRAQHEALVSTAISDMKEGDLSKVVLSRAISKNNPAPNPDALFQTLCSEFPDAFCYVFYHPTSGLWAGASPEILLQCENGQCTTMSLAGTRDLRAPRDTAWTEKEYEEQRIVTQYVHDRLINQGIFLGPIGPPRELRTGHLKHLVNHFEFPQPKNSAQVLNLLHPTPAVCGLPTQAARDYILTHERCDRSYYTGYVAHFGPNNSVSAYVNLRCMHWINDQVYLYAGGGITALSDAQAEFVETEAKLDAMLGVIEKMQNFEPHS